MLNGRGIGRRQFIKMVAAGAASAVLADRLALGQGPASRPDRRPNILVIMSDEHNASVLGCYGNKLIATPHLDGLAARGVSFTNHYCNSPLCVPSRLSFTAGKYASRVSAWNNNCWLPQPDGPSIATVLNDVGYESFLCGKMHYDKTRRYGFTEVGGNFNPFFMTGKGQRRAADDLKSGAFSERFKEIAVADDSSVMVHDRKVANGAIRFLAERKRTDKPFFLMVGFLAPHFPLIAPARDVDPYTGKVAMPDIPAGYLDRLPLNYKHLRAGFAATDVPEATVRKGREVYYGLTQWSDRQIGRVLDALAASPLAEDTVVIYTSDHGENMGEHGLWWKNCMFQTAARVPLIVAWPRRWKGGQQRTGACSLVDVVQTVAELGGARPPDDWNGQSLCRWLDDVKIGWKDLAVSEYYAHNIASGFAMVRTGSYKYVYHTPADDKHPAQRELYDLPADPGELTNLADRPEHKERVAQLHAALVKELGEDPDTTELRCRREIANGYGRAQRQPAASKADAAG